MNSRWNGFIWHTIASCSSYDAHESSGSIQGGEFSWPSQQLSAAFAATNRVQETSRASKEEPWHSCSELRGQPSLKARRPYILASRREQTAAHSEPDCQRWTMRGVTVALFCANVILTKHIRVAQGTKNARKLSEETRKS